MMITLQSVARQQSQRPFKAILYEMPPTNPMLHSAGAFSDEERRTHHRMRLWNSVLRRTWLGTSPEYELTHSVALEHDASYGSVAAASESEGGMEGTWHAKADRYAVTVPGPPQAGSALAYNLSRGVTFTGTVTLRSPSPP